MVIKPIEDVDLLQTTGQTSRWPAMYITLMPQWTPVSNIQYLLASPNFLQLFEGLCEQAASPPNSGSYQFAFLLGLLTPTRDSPTIP